MNSKSRNNKGNTPVIFIVVIVILSLVLIVSGLIFTRGIMKGYSGRQAPTEWDISGLTSGSYEQTARAYERSIYNDYRTSAFVKSGLAAGAYYISAVVGKASEKVGDETGNRSRMYEEKMQNSKMEMGEFSYISSQIDSLIDFALKKASEKASGKEEKEGDL